MYKQFSLGNCHSVSNFFFFSAGKIFLFLSCSFFDVHASSKYLLQVMIAASHLIAPVANLSVVFTPGFACQIRVRFYDKLWGNKTFGFCRDLRKQNHNPSLGNYSSRLVLIILTFRQSGATLTSLAQFGSVT